MYGIFYTEMLECPYVLVSLYLGYVLCTLWWIFLNCYLSFPWIDWIDEILWLSQVALSKKMYKIKTKIFMKTIYIFYWYVSNPTWHYSFPNNHQTEFITYQTYTPSCKWNNVTVTGWPVTSSQKHKSCSWWMVVHLWPCQRPPPKICKTTK